MHSHVPQEHNPQLPTLKVSQLETIATVPVPVGNLLSGLC